MPQNPAAAAGGELQGQNENRILIRGTSREPALLPQNPAAAAGGELQGQNEDRMFISGISREPAGKSGEKLKICG